jgi:hypothetical protein
LRQGKAPNGPQDASKLRLAEGHVSKPVKQVMIQVTGQPPLEAVPALFSNFVGVSRVAAEVQLEFIFLDLNQVATMIQGAEKTENAGPLPPVTGKTVVKIVMPSASFVQMKPHLEKIFRDIEKDMETLKHGDHTDASVRKSVNS